jgi:hypothetical protein
LLVLFLLLQYSLYHLQVALAAPLAYLVLNAVQEALEADLLVVKGAWALVVQDKCK